MISILIILVHWNIKRHYYYQLYESTWSDRIYEKSRFFLIGIQLVETNIWRKKDKMSNTRRWFENKLTVKNDKTVSVYRIAKKDQTCENMMNHTTHIELCTLVRKICDVIALTIIRLLNQWWRRGIYVTITCCIYQYALFVCFFLLMRLYIS